MTSYSRQILPLENPVMEYAWGSKTFIPGLLGRPVPAPAPAAELWMGAHPRAPSRVTIRGGETPLDRLIADDPGGTLGPRAAEEFGGKLPFLLKVLAVERPLSIQAHPDRFQAREGYRRENAAGMPVDGPFRNYRDPQPKPELLCALTPFRALCGFREPEEIAAGLKALRLGELLPAAAGFISFPGEESLRRLFGELLALAGPERTALLDRLAGPAGESPGASFLPPGSGALIASLREIHPGDPGVLSPLFLNLVRLEPEESIYLAPGVLHAYLKGAGVEIMAGSDNVLRGGLTVKHIDGEELGRILSCRCGPVRAGPARGGGVERVYPSPAEEFQLSRLLPAEGEPFHSGRRQGPEIVFCYRGRTLVEGGDGPPVELERGDSLFIPFGAGEYAVRGEAVLYRAALPPRGPNSPGNAGASPEEERRK